MKAIEGKGIAKPGRLVRYFNDLGRKEGLGAVVRMIERKVGRVLTAEECEALYAHAAAEGAERVGDLVFDLDGPALLAWLARPAP